MVDGALRLILRAEGAALLAAAAVAYGALDGSWLFFALLFFVPDISFLAYLINARAGAFAYNVLHSTIGPIVLGLAGWSFQQEMAQLVALIWIAHVGFDRLLGYGLKHASGFKDTHLGRL